MEKSLKRINKELYYYVDGEKIIGRNSNLSGDCSNLYGDCSNLSGNCSGFYGDCSNLSGNCSGLSGDCSGLSGDFDDCKIPEEYRIAGINLSDLINV